MVVVASSHGKRLELTSGPEQLPDPCTPQQQHLHVPDVGDRSILPAVQGLEGIPYKQKRLPADKLKRVPACGTCHVGDPCLRHVWLRGCQMALPLAQCLAKLPWAWIILLTAVIRHHRHKRKHYLDVCFPKGASFERARSSLTGGVQ